MRHWFHRHEWTEVDRQFYIKTGMYYPDMNGPATLITHKCAACPKYQQQKLDGHISARR